MAMPKRHDLLGGITASLFGVMEIILLFIALPVVRQGFCLSINEAQALVATTLLGIGTNRIVTGRYSDYFGRRSALIVSFALLCWVTLALLGC